MNGAHVAAHYPELGFSMMMRGVNLLESVDELFGLVHQILAVQRF